MGGAMKRRAWNAERGMKGQNGATIQVRGAVIGAGFSGRVKHRMDAEATRVPSETVKNFNCRMRD
jgi:hypothetical protein